LKLKLKILLKVHLGKTLFKHFKILVETKVCLQTLNKYKFKFLLSGNYARIFYKVMLCSFRIFGRNKLEFHIYQSITIIKINRNLKIYFMFSVLL